jgi:hypothetical protein
MRNSIRPVFFKFQDTTKHGAGALVFCKNLAPSTDTTRPSEIQETT